MTEKFLKAKHWQLFLFTYGILLIFQFSFMVSMISNFDAQSTPDLTSLFSFLKFFPLIIIIFSAALYGWLWSVAIGLQNKVPLNIPMKVKKFKIFLFIPMIYLLFIAAGITVFFNNFSIDAEPNFGLIGGLIAVIIPLHLFSMFCIFYCIYFAAKTYKTVELQRPLYFGDFAVEFFLIWFFPIGIWIIQPKINKMIEEKKTGIS